LPRVSQIRTVLSDDALLNTVPSVGLHWMSSTLPVWPVNALASTCQLLPELFHTWMAPAQSPVPRRPATAGDQSTAYPSARWPRNENAGLVGATTRGPLAIMLRKQSEKSKMCT